jgi:hypothetical protein
MWSVVDGICFSTPCVSFSAGRDFSSTISNRVLPFAPTMTPISRDSLIEELNRLADKLGKTPSANDMRDHGKHPVSTYQSRFGSWANAVSEAGFTPKSVGEPIPRDELIAELRRLAGELERPPSATDMKTVGSYSTDAYRNHFGSWNKAVEAAGFEPIPEGGERLQQDELLDELLRLADEFERPPTTVDMKEQGEYAIAPYYRQFESWEAALKPAEIAETT